MIKELLSIFILLTFLTSSFAQETQPNTSSGNVTAEQRMAQMEEELKFLIKQLEIEKAKAELSNQRLQEIINAVPKNSSLESLSGKTDFQDNKNPSAETIALSYEALKEVTSQINEAIGGDISRYSGIVLYNEPDFLALAKYRVFRSQTKIALRNYDLLAENLEKLNGENKLPVTTWIDKIGTKSFDPLTMALSLPSIGTSYARSVAELFSVFRTDTIITETRDTIDPGSLSTAMANELRKKNPNLKIFYPQAFIPEYDLESEGDDSLFVEFAKINSANSNLGELFVQFEKLSEQQRNDLPLKETISFAEMIKKQMQTLTIDETAANKQGSSEFRQLVRAEKLDRFLRGGSRNTVSKNSIEPQIGILKLRILASGGSRRETNNFFLGNKVTFSGSAVIEVLLFDADGTLRISEIFSLHTGFRKMKKNDR